MTPEGVTRENWWMANEQGDVFWERWLPLGKATRVGFERDGCGEWQCEIWINGESSLIYGKDAERLREHLIGQRERNAMPEREMDYHLSGASEIDASAWAALEGGIEAWRGIAKVCMALGREVVAQRGQIADLDKRLVDLERQQGGGK